MRLSKTEVVGRYRMYHLGIYAANAQHDFDQSALFKIAEERAAVLRSGNDKEILKQYFKMSNEARRKETTGLHKSLAKDIPTSLLSFEDAAEKIEGLEIE